ncbi:MAG: translation initiation factor IF-2 [Candidatus Omnitrophica bacterium]|nr:translation initiation factor IF-2 [Candidatus Omnitrophota bacterium]
MRVHELAKELGITSKELIAQIKKMGGDVKNHMSLVDDAMVDGLTKPEAKKIIPEAKKEEKQEKGKIKKAPLKKEKAKAEPARPASPKEAPQAMEKESEEGEEPLQAGLQKEEKKQDEEKNVIPIPIPVTVGNLADLFKIKIPELIKSLMGIGIFANVNHLLNEEIVFKVAKQLGLSVKKAESVAEKIVSGLPEDEDPKKLKLRPPVVTMMGHVDHGKTSLLDAIRKTNVAAREKGAITQHIGAYGVDIPGKGHVTFVDTPGHEAFTAMRARGANVTDVVVLVVAADDGIMPQTIEAISHAREAGCPMVVAINKVDLPAANVQKVMMQLQKIDLVPEVWGGKTICVEVSAKTGKGIEMLLEMLLLESEILELKANPDRSAKGTVVESHISKGSGPVATVLVQTGTLHVGDIIVCGSYMGRIRALRNDLGKSVREAAPSYAVEVSGLNGVPEAGEELFQVNSEKVAREITRQRELEKREREMSGAHKHLSLEDLYERISEGNFKELKMIIKADVQGSAEALTQSLEKLSTDKCRVRVIHSGMGGINESDVMLATASDAIVLGFHVKADPKAQSIAEKEGVDLRFYNIIYEVVEDVRKAMEGLLEPTYQEVIEGKAQIRKIFKSSKVGTIGGGIVVKGKVIRNNKARVIRDHIVVFDGKLSSLKRFKDDVRDVAQGYECGIAMDGFDDLRENDVIESYRLERMASKL